MSPHCHTTKHRTERGSLEDTGCCGRVGAYIVSSSEDTELGRLVCNAHPSPLRARESDVQSSESLHQGDLSVLVRFTSACVSAAVSVLQGFEAVPLLLTFLLLQPLLFPPLLVCDLE